MDFIKQFLVTGAIMGAFDAVWLTTMSKFYRSHIGQIMLDKPNFTAAIIFYVIYVVGIVVFVLSPALEKNSWEHALEYGHCSGLSPMPRTTSRI